MEPAKLGCPGIDGMRVVRGVSAAQLLDPDPERSLVPAGRCTVVTLGKFSGVHRGHQALLRKVVECARAEDALALALTFDRRPLEVLRPGTARPELDDLEERLTLLAALGLDLTLVLETSPALLAVEAEVFARMVLARNLRARAVVTGSTFRFGRGARGNTALLRRIGAEEGFTCPEAPPVLEAGRRISSSAVVAALEGGDVAGAARLLGRPYSVPGEVVRGAGTGSRLGFPTANVETRPCRLLPANGVYVARLAAEGRELPAVANLGVRPTFGGTQRVLEVHALGWNGDLYGTAVRVLFMERLRAEQRFPDEAALQEAIGADVAAARAWHAAHTPAWTTRPPAF
jgi:riboflavin kinase/FMN adenylyltransferase